MGIDELLTEKRKEILTLAAKYGIRNIRVFGSVARGQARGEDSDVDFLIDPPIGLGFKLMTFWIELEDLLGRKVDLIPEDCLRESLRPAVLREAVPL